MDCVGKKERAHLHVYCLSSCYGEGTIIIQFLERITKGIWKGISIKYQYFLAWKWILLFCNTKWRRKLFTKVKKIKHAFQHLKMNSQLQNIMYRTLHFHFILIFHKGRRFRRIFLFFLEVFWNWVIDEWVIVLRVRLQ